MLLFLGKSPKQVLRISGCAFSARLLCCVLSLWWVSRCSLLQMCVKSLVCCVGLVFVLVSNRARLFDTVVSTGAVGLRSFCYVGLRVWTTRVS